MGASRRRKIVAALLTGILISGLIIALGWWLILDKAKDVVVTVESAREIERDKGLYEMSGTLHIEEVVSSSGISYDTTLIVERYRLIDHLPGKGDVSGGAYRELGWEIFDDTETDLIEKLDSKRVRISGVLFSPCGDALYLRPRGSSSPPPCLFFSGKGYIHLIGEDRRPFTLSDRTDQRT